MSPYGFFLLMATLMLVQVMCTTGQRKKYRCTSEKDQNQRWCVTAARSTTQQPEPPRRIERVRTPSKPRSPGSRTVIEIRRKPSSGPLQEPASSPVPTSSKSFLYSDDYPKPSTKFSPDVFKFLTFPLKFIAAMLSPLMSSHSAAKHNASSWPLVNVHVPLTFSMVHSAAAPAAAATSVTYDANGSPIVCETRCSVYANNPPVPCTGGTGQPCGTGANTSPTPIPCAGPQPCGNGNANFTTSVTNAPPPGPSPTAAPPAASTSAPPTIPYRVNDTAGGSPNASYVYVLLCNLLNEIRPANPNATGQYCNPLPPPLSGGVAVADNETETIGPARPTPSATSCAPLQQAETSTRPTEPLEPDVDDGTDCAPPGAVLKCLMFAAARPQKTAACKPPCPLRTVAIKPKPSLCKHHGLQHAAASCPLLMHHTSLHP